MGNCKVIRNTADFGKAKMDNMAQHKAAEIGHKQGMSLRKGIHGVNLCGSIYPLCSKKLPHKDAVRSSGCFVTLSFSVQAAGPCKNKPSMIHVAPLPWAEPRLGTTPYFAPPTSQNAERETRSQRLAEFSPYENHRLPCHSMPGNFCRFAPCAFHVTACWLRWRSLESPYDRC
jgi:hypothetical protein